MAKALVKRDIEDEFILSKDINRGLCALAVLVWPAVIGLVRAGDRKLAMLLPWALLLALFSLHSLSCQGVGLIGRHGDAIRHGAVAVVAARRF